MTLCSACQSIDLVKLIQNHRYFKTRGRSEIPRGLSFNKTYKELRESAATCALCALFYQEDLPDPKYPNKAKCEDDYVVTLMGVFGDRWPRYTKPNEIAESLFGIEALVGQEGKNSYSYTKKVDIWFSEDEGDNSKASLAKLIALRPVLPFDDVSIISEWMKECILNHSACRNVATGLEQLVLGETVTLPTRVVDVGPADGSSEPFLLETNGQKGIYLTLSHCWGSSGKATMTTPENFADHTNPQKGIPLAGLSENFQHAVLTTRRLGFRYIWIDSLCIIQNDATDWQLEASKMAQVYSKSVLTLAAANTADSQQGFLQPRPSQLDTSVKVPYRDSSGASIGEFNICSPVSTFDIDVPDGPLHQRGWTFQEIVLSRRTVLFGKDQRHWQCQTTRWSEHTRFLSHSIADSVSASVSAMKGISHLPNDKPFIFKLWYNIVEEFTQRSLTKSSDKLPALSGIASVMNAALRTPDQDIQYAAGLWKEDIARGLLWSSYGPTLAAQRKVRPPSWSWSSLDSPVAYSPLGNIMKKQVTLIRDASFAVTTDPLNPFGEVSAARLTFTGSVRAIPRAEPCGPQFQTGRNGTHTNAILHDDAGLKIGGAMLDAPNDVAGGRPFFVVPVRYDELRWAGRPGLHQDSCVESLLLHEVVGEEGKGVYERAGVCEMRAMGRSGGFAEPFQVFLVGATERRITLV